MNLIHEPADHIKTCSSGETAIIGVDTSRTPVRLVVTMPADDGTVITEEKLAFDDLAAFQSYWTTSNSRCIIALPVERKDPLGIRAWITATHDRVETYEWSCYRAHLQGDVSLLDQALPEELHRAYVLALYAAYRRRAVHICRDIWAKLLEAAELVQTARHAAHRLSVALTEPPPSWPDEIPY